MLFYLDSNLKERLRENDATQVLLGLLLLLFLFLSHHTCSLGPGFVDKTMEKSSTEELFSYCDICDIPLPLRVRHCKRCRRCVLGFDHHCWFVGTCIGRKNHRTFLIYCISELLFVLWASHSLSYGEFFWPEHVENTFLSTKILLFTLSNIGRLCFFVIAVALGVFIGVLLIFHSILISTNQTTYEWSHSLRRHKMYPFPFHQEKLVPLFSNENIYSQYLANFPPHFNPFDQGILKNVGVFFIDSTDSKAKRELEIYREALSKCSTKRGLQKEETIFDNRYFSC